MPSQISTTLPSPEKLQEARAKVLARIAAAEASRPAFEGIAAPALLAVSKTFPAESVLALARGDKRF